MQGGVPSGAVKDEVSRGSASRLPPVHRVLRRRDLCLRRSARLFELPPAKLRACPLQFVCLAMGTGGGVCLWWLASWFALTPDKAPTQKEASAHEDVRFATKRPLRKMRSRSRSCVARPMRRCCAVSTIGRAASWRRSSSLLPHDAPAQRDAARAAQAAGNFDYAAAALERAHHFEKHTPDPELHYLRGEALYVLGRDDEARREHQIAELEIGPAPTDKMKKLWLARVYARRGYLVLADRLYESMEPPPPKFDSEVWLNHADAHLLNEDWKGAMKVLEKYLALDPKNLRAREMMAWAAGGGRRAQRRAGRASEPGDRLPDGGAPARLRSRARALDQLPRGARRVSGGDRRRRRRARSRPLDVIPADAFPDLARADRRGRSSGPIRRPGPGAFRRAGRCRSGAVTRRRCSPGTTPRRTGPRTRWSATRCSPSSGTVTGLGGLHGPGTPVGRVRAGRRRRADDEHRRRQRSRGTRPRL